MLWPEQAHCVYAPLIIVGVYMLHLPQEHG